MEVSMKINKKFFRIFCTGLAITLLFAACPLDGGPGAQIYQAVKDYLSSASGGSASNPVTLEVSISLDDYDSYSSDSNLSVLLQAINNSGKYVALDLSGCTLNGDRQFSRGGTSSLVVSIILPNATGYILDDAFQNWVSLRSITIPAGVRSIG
jgi:hypothetical protein